MSSNSRVSECIPLGMRNARSREELNRVVTAMHTTPMPV